MVCSNLDPGTWNIKTKAQRFTKSYNLRQKIKVKRQKLKKKDANFGLIIFAK
jgi:hypothetical protein